jgi:outer membrane protein OmpA-like peptidoglycan-associated protein
MRTANLASLIVLAALVACASGPASAPSREDSAMPVPAAVAAEAPAPAAPPPTLAEQRTAAASVLAVERQWLAAWFKGTPVVIAQRPNGAVTVDVPREFCFAAGQDVIKPALSAVLDKVAQSMRRTAIAEIHLISAPADVGGGAALALKRAARVRESLRSRGVTEPRLAKPSAASSPAVQLRIEAASPA